MNKEKRSLPRNMEEENAPPNRKKAALSESPDDAVSLLLLLSRGPCNPNHQSTRTKSAPLQLPQLVGPLGHYRRRKTSSRLEGIGRVVRFAPHPHVVSHVSDDEDDRERATTCSSSSSSSLINSRRWCASPTSSTTRHTIEGSPADEMWNNIPLFSMALAPPPRLPNVEFGTIVGGKSRD